MNTIDEVLAMNALSSKYSVTIHTALSWYFFVYPLFCNYLKLSPFSLSSLITSSTISKNARVEDDWIEAARQLVEDEFDLSYNPSYPSTSLLK